MILRKYYRSKKLPYLNKSKLVKCEICNSIVEESSVCPICLSKIEVITNEGTSWEQVFITSDQFQAELLTANLNRADIPANILSQYDTTRPLTFGDLAIIKIMVPAPYYAEAMDIIKLIDSGLLDNDEGK